MPTIHVQTLKLNSSPRFQVLTAKRAGWSYAQWIDVHIGELYGSGNSTQPASGSGSPLTHTVVWRDSSNDKWEAVFEVYGTQQELDDAVAALKARVIADGGTIVSG
jgi:hypothetical protein